MKIQYALLTAFLLMILVSFIPHYNYQPRPYISSSGNFSIQPILDNEELDKEYQFIQEFKVTYKDSTYCSDSSKLTFITQVDSFSTYNIRNKINCQIIAYFRLTPYQIKVISKYPTYYLKIENRVTDNVYKYKMDDPNYFTKLFKD
jgi:hypothetical protein